MDRSISVTTPESIAFSYELAGLGSRFLAVAIDFIIQLILTAAIVTGIVFANMPTGPRVAASSEPQWAQSAAYALIGAVIFLIFFGYFILFEGFRAGRTPGKQLVGIRVVRDGGYPIDFPSALIRNLVRAAEFAFGFYALSAAAALLSKQNKRVGDMAAGTIVVRDARVASLSALQANAGDMPRSPMLTPQEYALIDRFAARREGMDAGARGLLAAQIAGRIRPRLSEDLRRLDDDELLARLSAS